MTRDLDATIELAVRAKTRIKRRGRWAATVTSVDEVVAMAAVLDAIFEDHPEETRASAPRRAASPAPVSEA